MEKLFLLMLMLVTCCAVPQDLSGKVFVFPKENNRDHVKLITSQNKFNSVTVCLRFLTDLTRNYGLFSLATTTVSNAFMLFKSSSEDVIRVFAQGGSTDFLSLSCPPNEWHSMCTTWSSEDGVAQLWLDGKATVKRFIKTGPIAGTPITILGQEQDSHGGGFNANQSFLGMITNVHMWNHVPPAAEIKQYMDGKHFTPGNVLNWRSLDYRITGQVLVDEESEVM